VFERFEGDAVLFRLAILLIRMQFLIHHGATENTEVGRRVFERFEGDAVLL
jgi:hypothetical protein